MRTMRRKENTTTWVSPSSRSFYIPRARLTPPTPDPTEPPSVLVYSTPPTPNHVVQGAARGARLPRPPRHRRHRPPRQERRRRRLILHPRHGDERDSQDRPAAAAPRRRRPPAAHHGRPALRCCWCSQSHDGLLQRLRRHLRRLPPQGRSHNADGKGRNVGQKG